MQSNRGRPLTTSGSKFNQLAIPIIGLGLDRQPLRARWLALEPGVVGWGNHFAHSMRWEQGDIGSFPACWFTRSDARAHARWEELAAGPFFSKQPVNKFRGSPRVTCAVRALFCNLGLPKKVAASSWGRA